MQGLDLSNGPLIYINLIFAFRYFMLPSLSWLPKGSSFFSRKFAHDFLLKCLHFKQCSLILFLVLKINRMYLCMFMYCGTIEWKVSINSEVSFLLFVSYNKVYILAIKQSRSRVTLLFRDRYWISIPLK